MSAPAVASGSSRPLRLVVATLCGAAAAWVTVAIAGYLGARGKTGSDYDQLWIATQALLAGADPYGYTAGYWHWGLGYPLPTVVLTVPLAAFPLEVARALFTGLVVFALAWAAARVAWWRLALLASGGFIAAVMVSQWSPLLLAGVFVPWLSVFWVAKPTLGLALWAGWPHRSAAVGAVVATAASFAVAPDWVGQWLASVGRHPHFVSAIQRPFGWVLLLALLRWRRPEARFLAVLALVPHTEAWPDALLLLAVAQTYRELAALTLLSTLGLGLTWRFAGAAVWPGDMARSLSAGWPYLLSFGYLPALCLVLLRPNRGEALEWVRSVSARLAGLGTRQPT